MPCSRTAGIPPAFPAPSFTLRGTRRACVRLQSRPRQEGKAETLRCAARPGSRVVRDDIRALWPDTWQGLTRLSAAWRPGCWAIRPALSYTSYTDARGREVSPALRRPGLSPSW